MMRVYNMILVNAITLFLSG